MSQKNIYTVKLFAALKEHVGQESWIHESESELSARELLHAFFDRYPALDRLRDTTRIAINHAFCREDSAISSTDELAFIPPVSGG